MKSELERNVQQAVERYLCGGGSSNLVVAVSGGVDSMVLLHLLLKAQAERPLSLVVAHVEHGLRGEDSHEDARLVQQTCSRNQVPYYVYSVDPQLWQAKGNFQSRARQLRYTFFRQVGQDMFGSGNFAIATALTFDDRLEKFFMDLLRRRSLLNSPGSQSKDLLRPLDRIDKTCLIDYARHHGIPWREDSSNHSDAYLRNRVRNHLLPFLETNFRFNPKDCHQVLDDWDQAASYLNRQLDEIFQSICHDGPLDGRLLLAHEDFVQRQMLLRFFHLHSITPSEEKLHQTQGLLIAQGTRSLDVGQGNEVVMEYGRLSCRTKTGTRPQPDPLFLKECGQVKFGKKTIRLTQFAIQGEKRFSLGANLVIFPLIIRNRLPGDILTFAWGRVKLKKALIDRKVPRRQRDQLIVVENSLGEVIFVEGVGAMRPESSSQDPLEYTLEILCD